jgi:hypothetical protein
MAYEGYEKLHMERFFALGGQTPEGESRLGEPAGEIRAG